VARGFERIKTRGQGFDLGRFCVVGGAKIVVVGIVREMEATAAFRNAKSAAKTNLIYAMTMKACNLAPGHCTNSLLPFLETDPADDKIASWSDNFSGAFESGFSDADAACLSQLEP
jgi:hypothetical protein